MIERIGFYGFGAVVLLMYINMIGTFAGWF